MEKYLLKFASICVIIFGIFLVVKPDIVVKKLKSFYSRYPIVRYAGEKQLTSRPKFIVVFGIIIIFIGLICLIVG